MAAVVEEDVALAVVVLAAEGVEAGEAVEADVVVAEVGAAAAAGARRPSVFLESSNADESTGGG